eukprot:11715520-Alexandrium_andersonii.AAC.1
MPLACPHATLPTNTALHRPAPERAQNTRCFQWLRALRQTKPRSKSERKLGRAAKTKASSAAGVSEM